MGHPGKPWMSTCTSLPKSFDKIVKIYIKSTGQEVMFPDAYIDPVEHL